MSVFDIELIVPVQAAATSSKFSTVGAVTIMCKELALGESVTLQQTHDGSTWQNTILNGVIQTIDPKHTQINISGPGQYRVVKSVTAVAVGVMLWKTEAN